MLWQKSYNGKRHCKENKCPNEIYREKKINILSDINAELESRYLLGQFTNKSAEESVNDIVRLHPVDLGARKEELKDKYGQKIKDKKSEVARQHTIDRENSRATTKMMNLERFVNFLLPQENFLEEEPPIKKRVERTICKEKGIDAYMQA